MAEIDSRIRLFNKSLPKVLHQGSIPVQFLRDLRTDILENLLREKGVEVCHFEDIHSFCAPPANWGLSEKEWRLGLFPREQAGLLFRAVVNSTYGGNPVLEVLHPELIHLCKSHYPQFSVKTTAVQGSEGWRTNIYSNTATVNGILHPIADFRITIDEPVIRKRPESIYRYYGLASLPSNPTV